MFGLRWLTLRQARKALRAGRLDEAERLLTPPAVRRCRSASDLLRQVAVAYVERGERQLKQGDPEGAWRELVMAERVQGATEETQRLRQALVQRGQDEIEALLAAEEPAQALEAVARLRDRPAYAEELHLLEEMAQGWLVAREQAGRGDFQEALQTVQRLRGRRASRLAALERFAESVQCRQERCAPLLRQLAEAADRRRWREVVDTAGQVLSVAPQHEEARRLRSRAWHEIEPATVALHGPASVVHQTLTGPSGQRFLLWIDGVGGYLVCLGSRITVGQATASTCVDVPVFADVSRLHATLTRDAEGYLLEGLRPVQVNGQPVERALLRPNDRVTLGTSFQVQFRQPAPVSASARLDLVSGHRLALAVEAVLLMADTLILGPGSQVHVSMPNLKEPVVLFRQKQGLGLRYPGRLLVDGQAYRERAPLAPNSRVASEEFVFALENVGQGIGQL